MKDEYLTGIFVREEKNRFLCTVKVDGIVEECYIPSSCRLDNFINLSRKEVILKQNINRSARTRFAVYAIKYKRNYIILRTAEANDIIRDAIGCRRFSFLGKRTKIEKEKTIDGYKADLFFPETNTIMEIKSIITTQEEAVFPTVYSERAISQFYKIKELLRNGYKVVYVYVSLNPYIKQVRISKKEKILDYRYLLDECIKMGMQVKAYSAEIKNYEPVLKSEIKVVL